MPNGLEQFMASLGQPPTPGRPTGGPPNGLEQFMATLGPPPGPARERPDTRNILTDIIDVPRSTVASQARSPNESYAGRAQASPARRCHPITV